MLGILMAVAAGAAMSFQGVVNTRLGERIGLLESNVWVQGTAFALGLAVCALWGRGDFAQLRGAPWPYWCGGALGLVITLTVMLAIGNLSATWAISVILIAQLLSAAAIDAFGWLGAERVPFGAGKWIGLALMLAGVVAFKWGE